MNRSVAFYRDTLGMTARTESAWWTDFPVGDAAIGLHPPFQGGGPISPAGWIVGIEVDDLVALRNKLAEDGYPASAAFHDVPGGVVLEFSDPDGYPIQAIQLGVKAADLH